MKKKSKNLIILVGLILLCTIILLGSSKDDIELKTIKSKKQLSRIYEGENNSIKETFTNMITTPFSFLNPNNWRDYHYNVPNYSGAADIINSFDSMGSAESTTSGNKLDFSLNSSSSSKDYSTTNIQVENVDEADINKTDGDYIYSISETNVIITNVMDPNNIEIAATINSTNECVPEDLILYKDKLIVIYTEMEMARWDYYYSESNNTVVKIYDITQKTQPVMLKEFKLYEPYYTSRCIENKLYVISTGYLREEDEDKNSDDIITYYEEGYNRKEIGLDNIKYLKDIKTKKQTLISLVDLDDVKADINVSSYLIDISNAYVSQKNIYLLDQEYKYENEPPISSLFGLKGAIGPFVYESKNDYDGYYTQIYKFNILEDGYIKYDTKTEIKGKTINQYSLDELNGHLRIALYDDDGARVAIFDEDLKEIGISRYVAKGERMYSSRFIKNKVYLVTYKTVDPLFVIDLSDETNPKVLGELKIPGYSIYLHPYDENHIIGIGMETEEVVNRNSSGKVISTDSRIIGMKMALFDVSDVNNPKQISSTVIGDRRTTSAILNNPKALLFSKEKGLIAIPVNNYSEDFEIDTYSETNSSVVNAYQSYKKDYIAEGYLVYDINIENGFGLKGLITHETKKKDSYYSYYTPSKLLRGLYIENNLFTVSETAVKVNDLETLELISELKIK